MFLHYRTCGIVLKKEDRAEADQLLTLYSRDFGKIEVLGKALRKIDSKLRSGADLFTLSEIEFIQGKTHKILTDAMVLDKFSNIKKSLARLRLAWFFSDLISELTPLEVPDSVQEELVRKTFYQLNNPAVKRDKFFRLYLYFFWNFISHLGYAPELYCCLLCEEKITPGPLYFSSANGGVVCGRCLFKVGKGTVNKITPETVKILRILTEKKWPLVSRVKLESERTRLKAITEDYLMWLRNTNAHGYMKMFS